MVVDPHHHLVERALQIDPTPDNNYQDGGGELEEIIHTLVHDHNDTALEQLLAANDSLQHITLSCLAMHGYWTLIQRTHIPDRCGESMCHYAIIEGHLHIVYWLYQRGYRADFPLWFAVRYGHLHILDFLLNHSMGEDIEAWEHIKRPRSRHEYGDPIKAALQYRYFHILDYLDERGWAWTEQHHIINQQLAKPWVSPKLREKQNKHILISLWNCISPLFSV